MDTDHFYYIAFSQEINCKSTSEKGKNAGRNTVFLVDNAAE